MSKVTLIIGLPASGKTTLANQLVQCSLQPAVCVDDAKEQHFSEIQQAIKDGKDIYITDPHLCYEYNLKAAKEKLEQWGATQIECIYFENNPEACLQNVKRRNDGRNVEEFIRHASSKYKPPTNMLLVGVYQDEND